jgi:uncharacterized protein YyaL (SSP411 family)
MATAKVYDLTPEQANDRIVAALEALRVIRAKRPRPLLDDKIITAWNGLMISALAKGYQILVGENEQEYQQREGYLHAAVQAAEFIERELYDAKTGVLFRSWRLGRGSAEGFAEDYAFLIQGLLDLYEANFDLRWLKWAEQLQRTMDLRFWDEERGGYFTSQSGDANIVLRLKESYDGAEPAASSVAAVNLLRFGAVFDRAAGANEAGSLSYRDRGKACIAAFQQQWSTTPQAMPLMLTALELALDSPRHVVFAGETDAADFQSMAAVLHEKLGPRRSLLAVTVADGREWLESRAPWLSGMKPVEERATAYVCEEFTCQAPVTDPEELRRLLG